MNAKIKTLLYLLPYLCIFAAGGLFSIGIMFVVALYPEKSVLDFIGSAFILSVGVILLWNFKRGNLPFNKS